MIELFTSANTLSKITMKIHERMQKLFIEEYDYELSTVFCNALRRKNSLNDSLVIRSELYPVAGALPAPHIISEIGLR